MAKPGTIVWKTWRVINKFNEFWPDDTKLVSVTEGLCFESPKILLPSPGGKLDVSVKIWVPENSPKEGFVHQYIMRLYCSKFKCFGEPMIATIMMESKSFDDTKKECLKSMDFSAINRVSDFPEDIVLYKKAYDAMQQGKGTF